MRGFGYVSSASLSRRAIRDGSEMPRTAPERFSSTLTATCLLQLLLCATVPAAASAASLAIHVQKKDGKPLVGAVLIVTAESPRLPPVPATHAVVDQVD